MCGNSRYQVCNNIEEIDTFTSIVTMESLKIIIIFAVMINVSFTFWPARDIRNNIQEKLLIDLDYGGTTKKKVIWNS